MSNIYGGRGLGIAGGQGAEVQDLSGKKYIDFLCGNGSALFGHGHPVLKEAAHKALEFPWTVSPGLKNGARDELRSVLASLMPEGKVFLGNSGTEAMEAALKLAVSLRPERKKIVALRRSFHGRTMGSLALTFNPQYRKSWLSLLFPVQHVKMEEVAEAIDSDTAAVFVEPVQGEGGVYPLPEEVANKLTARCKETGALLVADEIQTGWGRCGAVLASETIGLEPDIVTLAKGLAGGLPIGAALWKGSLGDFPAKGHGSTYGGNPVVASVALASWRLLKSEDYPAQAIEKGKEFVAMIEALHSPLILDIRHKGLLIGVELSIKADPVVKGLQEEGVLALNAGPQVLRFLPPFVAEKEHFQTVVSKLEKVLASC